MSNNDQNMERRYEIVRERSDKLFQRVLLEGPRADEFFFIRPDNNMRLYVGCNTPRRINGRWYGANYVPYKHHYVRPEGDALERPIPGDIWNRARWHVSLKPQNTAVGIWGVRVYNPKLFPTSHAFVCAEDPKEFERRNAELRNDPHHPDAQQWHLCCTDDEIVEAAIRCIKGRM
jgi:hypothetical protein